MCTPVAKLGNILGVVCDIVIGEIGGLDSPRAWELTLVAKPVPVRNILVLIFLIVINFALHWKTPKHFSDTISAGPKLHGFYTEM